MPDLTPDLGELERRHRYTEQEWAEDILSQIDEVVAREGIAWTTECLRQALADRRRIRFGSLNGALLLRHIDALLAERERLRAERDELLQRCGQAIAFVQTGGPLFTKDRLELLAILYHAAPDGAEGAPDA